MTVQMNRRSFLAGSGAVLLVPLTVTRPANAVDAVAASRDSLTAYLRIATDGTVTIMTPVSEMGQGTWTGHAAIIADELGVDIANVRLQVPEQPAPAYRLPFGQMRSVGSFGIRAWIEPLRRSAAQARTILMDVAAERLGVPRDTLDVEDGHVVGAGERVAFGDLVEDAVGRELPEEPILRPAETRRYVGRSVPRVDTPQKVDGSAVYGIDIRLPGMLYGAVHLTPVFGAEVEHIDEASAPGSIAVAEVPGGAVVVAESWWKAKQLADGLAVTFTTSPHASMSSADISRAMREGLDNHTAEIARENGDTDGVFEASAQVVEADYEVPFLTHVSMEPITCTAQISVSRCDVWMSTQGHDVVLSALEAETGLPAEAIFIHTTLLGGGFGRKTHGEIAVQAVRASRAAGGRPVNVIWSREDDVRYGQYRPAMTVRMRAALSQDGRIEALDMRLSGPMMGREYVHVPNPGHFDFFSHAVLGDQPYAETFRLTHNVVDVPPSTCPWRAVSSSQNGFFLEAFIDEAAHAAGQDPLTFRKAHLAGQPSFIAVLESVERRSGWGEALPGPNWGRGVAVVESYAARVAQVADVEMVDGRPVVRRVWLAIDCGEAVNPGQVEAQMTGSVIDALGPTLRCAVTLANGRAEQSNFDGYPILRMDEVPQIDVEIVSTGQPIGGVGEPGVPPVAPAVANAVFAATGTRKRMLPLDSA